MTKQNVNEVVQQLIRDFDAQIVNEQGPVVLLPYEQDDALIDFSQVETSKTITASYRADIETGATVSQTFSVVHPDLECAVGDAFEWFAETYNTETV